MKKLLSIIFVLWTVLNVLSQENEENNVDSLLQILRFSEENYQTVDYFNDLTQEGIAKNIETVKDSFLLFQEKNIQIARRLNYKEGLAQALYNLGKFYISQSNTFAKATPCLLESLSVFEELGNNDGCSSCYMQLGLISYILQYYEDAIKNLELSFQYKNNSVAKYLMALAYSELEQFAVARKHFDYAIQEYKQSGNTYRLNECYMYLGESFEKQNQLDSAFHYLKLALRGIEQIGDSSRLIRPFALISSIYLKSDQVDESIYHAELSLTMNNSESDIISKIEAMSTLSEAYALKGDYKKAHYYLQQFNAVNNSYVQGSTKQKVADMQSMFEYKKKINEEKIKSQKDKEIADQQIKQQKILRNAFVIGTMLLLVLSLVLFNRYKIKRNSAKALEEKNSIITEEKARSENLLLNILPAEIAEELKEKGEAEARDFEMVSILFTDFKGFTEVSSKMSASDLVSEINVCFKAFDSIVENYGIEKIKTIGDAYMAAGGLPIPDDDSVINTVNAALEMQEFISQRKRELDDQELTAFEMRVGIHTGPVVAGIVGIKKFQYDVWGDTVNTAARLENHGEVGEVNISQATYDLIKDYPSLEFKNRGNIQVKGKGELSMWFVNRNKRT